MEANPRKFFVAEQGSQLIGMLNLLVFQRMPKPGKEPSCWVYLGNVYVLPAFRNAGVGGRLVDASIEFSGRIRATLDLLHSQVPVGGPERCHLAEADAAAAQHLVRRVRPLKEGQRR